MSRALIIGASGGVGAAIAAELTRRGDDVTTLSRSLDGFDITNEASIQAGIETISGSFDLILVASGALANTPRGPEKTIASLDAEAMAAQFRVNAIGPTLVLKHCLPLLHKYERTVFAALSARVGSIGDNALGGWYSYRASKAALNQLIKTASIEIARKRRHAICVALHPGTVATAFTQNYPHHHKVEPDQAARNLLSVIDGLTESDTGLFFDWAGKQVPW